MIEASCHCGALRYRLLAPRLDGLRHCGCSFCRRHAPLWGSAPDGEVAFEATGGPAPLRYRFGHESADFLICARCGVLLAAVTVEQAPRAVLNLRCADSAMIADLPVQPVSHDGESGEQRAARRHQRWTPVTHRIPAP